MAFLTRLFRKIESMRHTTQSVNKKERQVVDYIGIECVRRLIAQTGSAAFIQELSGAIELDYRRCNEFHNSARHAIHSPVGLIELMPTSDGQMHSFKYVNGHPKNTAAGLLADVATGYPVLLSELTVTTALRTAAMSALAAK